MNNDHHISQLRNQGFRVTPQRLAILEILQESDTHLTPAEIYQRAKHKLPSINEATVYRSLDFLTRQGLLLCAHMGSGRVEYEFASAHHHLVCQRCGYAKEITHTVLESVYRKLEGLSGFKLDTSHLTFFGLCPNCQQDG